MICMCWPLNDYLGPCTICMWIIVKENIWLSQNYSKLHKFKSYTTISHIFKVGGREPFNPRASFVDLFHWINFYKH